MNGKHYARTTSRREGECSLIHGSWRRVGIKIAATGACALMAGQLLLPGVALATELEDAAAPSAEVAAAAVVPSTSADGGGSANSLASEPAAGSGLATSQLPAAGTQATMGSQGSQAGVSDAATPPSSGKASSGASSGQAASGTASATTSGAQTQGVSDVTDGSKITVKTTVRNNYTDTREDRTIDLLHGTATVKGDYSCLNGDTLAFEGLGALPVQASYDEANKQTAIVVDMSGVARQQKERRYETACTEFKNMMTTAYTGSKLTYTGTTYERDDIIIGSPDDVFGGSGGTAIINEIRDDYYTRHHVWVKFQLAVPAAEPSAVSTISVINAKTDYAPGETPRANATVPAADADKYEIAYECWEEMSGDDPRDLQPVAYWYSDASKYPTGAKRITQFEEGKFYMYSVELRLKGDTALDSDFDVTVNGRPSGIVLRTADGVLLPNAASMLCEQPIDEEQAIDVVEVDGATTTFKAGDKPVFTAGVSGVSNSIFQCEFWMGNDGSDVNSQKFWDENIANHIDAFKAGVTYRYGFYLKAQRGFYFTRDTKVKINGRLYSFEWSESDKEAFDRYDGKSDTMWVYTDLTMTPEAAPAPIDPEKPNTGGSETPEPGTESDQKLSGTSDGKKRAEASTSTAKTVSTVKAVKAAKAKPLKKTAAANPLPATGDDAALTVVAMGVAGATVATAGIAVARRRS